MLGQIGEILAGIWDFLIAVCDFLLDTLKGLADFALNLAKLPSFFSTIFSNGMIPAVVSGAILSGVAVLIILRIIGRDG